MARFGDRVAIVTGAGAPGGIGVAMARELVAEGARVVLGATSERVHQRAAELGDSAVGTVQSAVTRVVPTRIASRWKVSSCYYCLSKFLDVIRAKTNTWPCES